MPKIRKVTDQLVVPDTVVPLVVPLTVNLLQDKATGNNRMDSSILRRVNLMANPLKAMVKVREAIPLKVSRLDIPKCGGCVGVHSRLEDVSSVPILVILHQLTYRS